MVESTSWTTRSQFCSGITLKVGAALTPHRGSRSCQRWCQLKIEATFDPGAVGGAGCARQRGEGAGGSPHVSPGIWLLLSL